MSADMKLLLVLAAFAASVVLAVLAWRGKVSWGLVAGGVGVMLALLGLTPRPEDPVVIRDAPAPPPPRPAAEAIAPVVAVSDARAVAELADIEAAADADGADRLDRLAGLNQGGRQ